MVLNLRWRGPAAPFLLAWLTASSAHAEPPREGALEEAIDCTQPGPGRVPMQLAADGLRFKVGADVPESPPGAKALGTRCRDAPLAPGSTCTGDCTLYLRPGRYGLQSNRILEPNDRFDVGPTGARVEPTGSEIGSVVGLILAAAGGLTVGVTAIADGVADPTGDEATPYYAAMIAGVGATLLGIVVTFVFMPGTRATPLPAPSTASRAGLTVAPVPGGAVLSGSVSF
jgi:hypothetical protein